jgi:hypothetical protein
VDVQTHKLSFDEIHTIYKMMPPTVLLLLHVFIAIGMSTEPLPNDRRDTQTDEGDL